MIRGTPEARWLAVYGAAVVAHAEALQHHRDRIAAIDGTRAEQLDDEAWFHVVSRAEALADTAEKAAEEIIVYRARREGRL